jgi:acyl carrier protein
MQHPTHMTREQAVQEILAVLAEVRGLDPNGITESSDLRELGVTSLDALSISFELENRFQVTVPDERLPTFRTVGDVVDVLLELSAQAGS